MVPRSSIDTRYIFILRAVWVHPTRHLHDRHSEKFPGGGLGHTSVCRRCTCRSEKFLHKRFGVKLGIDISVPRKKLLCGWGQKELRGYIPFNPFRTAVSFWGLLGTNNLEFESPKQDWSSKGVNTEIPFRGQTT